MKIRSAYSLLGLALLSVSLAGIARGEIIESTTTARGSRIASFFLSEDLINTLLHENLKTPYLQDVSITLDSVKDQVVARGLMRIPPEELKAINIEKGLGDFRFQLAIKLSTTRHGHLLFIFPLDQTFFYPASSENPMRDRVVIPVQLISLALGSARGYLAQYSGDFSGLDKKTQDLQQQLAGMGARMAATRDPDERETLEISSRSLVLQLQNIPLERKQAEQISKKLAGFLGFVGENEINLNQELSARRNALMLRVKLAQLAPYLQDIELGGVRLLKDERDGSGMNFMAIDINADIPGVPPEVASPHKGGQVTSERPPQIMIRLHQALLESPSILEAEKKDLGTHIRNFSLDFKDDGIHAVGDWHVLLLPSVPFDAVVDFVWVANNAFEIRVRDIRVAHVELAPLTKVVLEIAKKRLDQALKGACTFEYVGEEKDHSRAIRVTINMSALVPAFPKMVLTGVAIHNKTLILKAGQP